MAADAFLLGDDLCRHSWASLSRDDFSTKGFP
jgi:hypothetical protein